jgi:hypothetical protein
LVRLILTRFFLPMLPTAKQPWLTITTTTTKRPKHTTSSRDVTMAFSGIVTENQINAAMDHADAADAATVVGITDC